MAPEVTWMCTHFKLENLLICGSWKKLRFMYFSVHLLRLYKCCIGIQSYWKEDLGNEWMSEWMNVVHLKLEQVENPIKNVTKYDLRSCIHMHLFTSVYLSNFQRPSKKSEKPKQPHFFFSTFFQLSFWHLVRAERSSGRSPEWSEASFKFSCLKS